MREDEALSTTDLHKPENALKDISNMFKSEKTFDEKCKKIDGESKDERITNGGWMTLGLSHSGLSPEILPLVSPIPSSKLFISGMQASPRVCARLTARVNEKGSMSF